MTSKKNTLLSFFTSNKKIRRENENNETEVNSPVRKITEVNKSACTTNSLESFSEASNSRLQQDDFICENNQTLGNANDIGYFVECLSLTDADKKLVLTNLWVPDVEYKFPLLAKNEKRGLRFQHKWLKEFNWLAYSNVKNGTFCKYCVLFAKNGGVGSQPLGSLVTVAFSNWKKAKETFRARGNLKYHTLSVLDSEHFLK
ncbi:uncharacterized protein LOC132944973 [Metopolophium dirhodum]|uniref:uncharacterized protein LOC132944973 n=1 Tax=Metopolophium dirhodum TaxID=44670 RepID=UPI0029905EBE|nr:uncharacterized protein LOC132944973 [Metopolophium dirhodum]